MSSVVLATAGYDHTIRFWEATSGICYRTLQYADSQVNRLEITAEKSLVAAAGNGQIRLYEVNSNDPQPVFSYDGHAGNVTAVGFQKDSKWLFSGERVRVRGALAFFFPGSSPFPDTHPPPPLTQLPTPLPPTKKKQAARTAPSASGTCAPPDASASTARARPSTPSRSTRTRESSSAGTRRGTSAFGT
jgi:hypothetical protein